MKLTRYLGLAALLLLLTSPAQAQQSTLIIRSDADCALTVNGMSQGQVSAGAAKPVSVGPGEQLVECVGAGGAKAEQVLEVFPGTQKVVNIQMAAKAALVARFQGGAGTVLDTQTGLTWMAKDNGYDINWNDARSYCSRISPGSWSLPSMSELQRLSGSEGATASPLFKLTGSHWSNELDGSEKARIMALSDGYRGSFPVSYPDDGRALCVRRSS